MNSTNSRIICLVPCRINMVATKRCAWGTWKNDSRYPHLMNKNENGDPVYFYRFPSPKRSQKNDFSG